MESSRAWAEIDLDAMTSNLAVIRQRVAAHTAVLLVAKADAYGHGAIAVAHHAIRCGIEAIGVTTCTEALELRRAGIRARTVVLGPVLGEEAPAAIRHGIELCLPSDEVRRAVESVAKRLGRSARVHVKIDTGMGRLGVSEHEAVSLLQEVDRSPSLELAGVMTHLAAVDEGARADARRQLDRFDSVVAHARSAGFLETPGLWIHALNSAAVLSGELPHYDAVRIGIAAYGVSPMGGPSAELEPVLTVRTRIAHLRHLSPGDAVGYGATWRATRPSTIAVLPVGYDDGVSWRLGNRGAVLIRGERAPIVGRVSMDYTTVDVTDIEGIGSDGLAPAGPEPGGIEVGERATLLGRDRGDRIRVEELAEQIGTIPYEVMCSIGKRVARTYIGGTRDPALTLEPHDLPAPPVLRGRPPDHRSTELATPTP